MTDSRSRMTTKGKIRLLIKCFLASNKGKKYTSKEISDFINNNRFGLQTGVNSTGITKMINAEINIE